jgi:hypothetical protein
MLIIIYDDILISFRLFQALQSNISKSLNPHIYNSHGHGTCIACVGSDTGCWNMPNIRLVIPTNVERLKTRRKVKYNWSR